MSRYVNAYLPHPPCRRPPVPRSSMRNNLSHISKGVPDELGRMDGTGIVNIDGKGCHLKDIVLEPHECLIVRDNVEFFHFFYSAEIIEKVIRRKT
jgi:hypothetical protein